MADEIRAGDVVVCVAIHPWHEGCTEGPQIGGVYRVVEVDEVEACRICGSEIGAAIAGFEDPDSACCINEFRKLPPADEQFTREMQAMRPAKTPVFAIGGGR